ncbi:MAG: VacJ family lipoprotein [Limnohabitans sp.]
MSMPLRCWVLALTLAAVGLLQGCATVQPPSTAADPRDPWEGFNRRVHAFNDKIDLAVAKPVAQTYVQVVPSFVRTGVGNFLNNLTDVRTLTNAVLQLKPQVAVETLVRIQFNTVLGLGGLIDIASEMGLPHHREDFGQTLGRWGVPSGPYIVLPLLGPSTVRDTAAIGVDSGTDIPSHFFDRHTARSLQGLRVIDKRASLLVTVDAMRAAALDSYTFARDAYLQKRLNDVHDGNPPSNFDFSDPDKP